MAFIAGKGFAILNSKAEKGDQKAKDLLAKLNTIDQDEADRLFSEILGKGGGGGSKSKKTKAPGASATDGQGEITEGAGEQAPTGKAAPKAKGEAPIAAPAEPTGEVKPKGKNYQLEIDDLSDKLSEVRQGRMDGDADEIRARIKELKGKKKAQGKAEPKGKVTPKTEAPAGQAVPKTRQELQKTLNDFGIPTNEYVTKAAELDKAGIKDDKQFISEMLKLTENKEPLKRGGKNAKAFVQKFTQDKPYFQDEYQQEEIGTAYELLNGDERLTEAAAVAGSQFQVSPSFIKDNKLVVPYGEGDFEFAEGDYFTQDRKNRLNIIDLDKFAQSQGIGGGGSQAPAQQEAESNVPSQFKDGNDAAKFGVFMSVKDAIDDDLDFDENEIKQIANEYGVSTKEVSQIIRGYQKRKQGGTTIDTAGANVQPAGAFGDIEPETQQLAGIGPIEKLQYKNPENAEGFKKEMSALVDRIKNLRPLTEEDAEQLGLAYDLTPDEIDKAMREIGAKEKAATPDKQQARQRIDSIMQEGRGGISLEEAEQLSEEFGIPVDGIRALETQSQIEIPFPAPDQGEAIPADQDFDAQGNPLGNPGQTDEERDAPFEQAPNEETQRQVAALDREIERIRNTQYRNPDDAKNFVDDITNYESDGRALTESEFNYYASQNNLSKDEAEKAYQEYGDKKYDNKPYSFDEQAPAQENFTPDEQNRQEFEAIESATTKINELKKQGRISNEEAEQVAREFRIPVADVLDIIGDQDAQPAAENKSIFSGTPEKELFASSNQQSQTDAERDAPFEAADPNNLTPDEFDRMDFEAGEGLENLGAQGYNELIKEIKFNPTIIREDEINKVAQKLQLEGKTPEQLTQIRDGVVRSWQETSQRGANMNARAAMSAITAAIDSYIMGSNKNKAAAKPAQAQSQIKQTVKANAQQATPQAPAKAAAQPQQQQGTAAKPDRKKLEAAAADLGVDANLLEGLLELLKKVR
jgi:hypothetical protein